MRSEKPLIIWGARGQAVVLEEFTRQLNYQLVAIFDNDLSLSSPFDGVDIHYGREDFDSWLTNNQGVSYNFIVAIGGSRGRDRVSISRYLEDRGLEPASAIHPEAYVSSTSTVGIGCQIMGKAIICARAQLGDYCLINTAASVDHECSLGKGVHIGPGVNLAGNVTVGNYSFIGIGAIVLPNIKIGPNSIVGAGSVVTRDVPEGVVCLGNPAKLI